MFDNTFKKVFWSLIALFIVLEISSIIYGLANNLKIYSSVNMTIFAVSIVFAFCMSLFISSNMKINEMDIQGIENKEKLVTLLERQKYSRMKLEGNKIVFKLNAFPSYIYNNISVVIEIDEDNNRMKVKGPSYLIKILDGLITEESIHL